MEISIDAAKTSVDEAIAKLEAFELNGDVSSIAYNCCKERYDAAYRTYQDVLKSPSQQGTKPILIAKASLLLLYVFLCVYLCEIRSIYQLSGYFLCLPLVHCPNISSIFSSISLNSLCQYLV